MENDHSHCHTGDSCALVKLWQIHFPPHHLHLFRSPRNVWFWSTVRRMLLFSNEIRHLYLETQTPPLFCPQIKHFFYCPTKSTLNNKNTKKKYNTVGNLNVNDRTAWTVITELCKHINLHRNCKTRSGSGLVARHPLWFHCGIYTATQPSSMPVTSSHVY